MVHPLPIAVQARPVVYTKATWAGSWVETPLLQAISIADQAAPAHASAVLRWKYGYTIQPAIGVRGADSTLATVTRGGWIGYYVQIVAGSITWYGIIQDVSDTQGGALNGTDPSGVEIYTAFGLTWLLEQAKPITQSLVKTAAGNVIIDRAIAFNSGTDGSRRTNRITSHNYDATQQCFTDKDNTTTPANWTAAQAIAYLLTNFPPKSSAGTTLVPFALDSGASAFLDYELPRLDYHGESLWRIINAIVDRKRGLGWNATVVSGTVKIVVWSQNQTLITLPSGGTIPANANQVSYDFDSSVNIVAAGLETTLLTQFDQVLILGERVGSIFTVKSGTNMDADWSTTDATKYNNAATAETGYSSLSDSDKEASNNDRRAADDLSKVFSWFRLSKTWNFKAYSTGTPPFALPKFSADGVIDYATSAKMMVAGLRFEKFIPARPHIDYTATDPIVPSASDADLTDADFIAPFVLFQALPLRSSDDDGWLYAERLNQSNLASSSKRPYEYSVDVSVKHDGPGVILRTVGVPQHYLATDLYVPNAAWEDVPAGDGFVSTNWLATIYVLHDQRVRSQYPLDASLPTLDVVRQKQIDIADAYCDIVLPGTVMGATAGKLLKTTSGGFLRDDRTKIQDLARLAYAWYGQTRRTLKLSFREVVSGFAVGNLVTTIGSGALTQTVNTCITSVVIDLESGTTQLTTQFGELDFSK